MISSELGVYHKYTSGVIECIYNICQDQGPGMGLSLVMTCKYIVITKIQVSCNIHIAGVMHDTILKVSITKVLSQMYVLKIDDLC